ncbi:MAG: EamA family transporter [Acidobacteriaceae bacterium]|nr:EamA family transporter [Acidobacteriaceae bacterium]
MRLFYELRRLLLTEPEIQPKHQRLAYTALTAVCFFWGTTYLGIRISLESIPPFYLIASRYVISGAILLVAAAVCGAHLPRGRELLYTALCGVICIGVGIPYSPLQKNGFPAAWPHCSTPRRPFGWLVSMPCCPLDAAPFPPPPPVC